MSSIKKDCKHHAIHNTGDNKDVPMCSKLNQVFSIGTEGIIPDCDSCTSYELNIDNNANLQKASDALTAMFEDLKKGIMADKMYVDFFKNPTKEEAAKVLVTLALQLAQLQNSDGRPEVIEETVKTFSVILYIYKYIGLN